MPKTVLIVDDSTTMRQMLGDALRRAGFAVLEGVNGADALERLTGRSVQLVITDFNMPVMGGIALVKQLRARAEFRFTPILILTTEAGDDKKGEGRAAGATGWMVKPFDPERLIQVVRRLAP
jgi:two-component system chemotaxis response regulator CheY